jgi:hypothetical protein
MANTLSAPRDAEPLAAMRISTVLLVAAIAALGTSLCAQPQSPALPQQPGAIGVIAGRVVDEAGTTVPRARVILRDTSDKPWVELETIRTGEDGVFAFESVATAKACIAVSGKGMVDFYHHVDSPTTGLVIRLRRATSAVEGHVFLKSTGEGVASATVSMRITWPGDDKVRGPKRIGTLCETEADETGAFRFERVPAGEFTLGARKGGLREVPVPLGEATHTVAENQTARDLRVELFAGRTVRGRVIEKVGGKPVAGVRIDSADREDPEGKPAETDANGEYRLPGFFGTRNGMCVLSVTKKGWRVAADRGDPGDEVSLSLPADTSDIVRDIEMVQNATVSGRILGPNGSPVAGARITPIGQDQPQPDETEPLVSGPDGSYQVPVLPGSDVMLRVHSEAPLLYGMSKPVKVLHQPVGGVDISVGPPCSVAGVVETEDGRPIVRAGIMAELRLETATSGEDERYRAGTDASGRFEIAGMQPGSYELSVSHSDFLAGGFTPLELKPGETRTDLRARLKRSKAIEGKVIPGSTGEPVGERHVGAWMESNFGFMRFAISKPDGSFKVTGLEAGNYKIGVQKLREPGFAGSVTSVAADTAGVVVELGKGVEGPSQEQAAGARGVPVPVGIGSRRLAGYEFKGLVVDCKTSQPVTDFSVTREGYDPVDIVRGPEPGMFRIKWSDPFIGRLRIHATGYLPLRTDPLEFPKDSTTAERTFQMGTGAAAFGRFVCDGKPVEGARVCVYAGSERYFGTEVRPPAGECVTDGDGKFRIERLPAGPASIAALLPASKVFVTRQLALAHGQDLDVGELAAKGPVALKGRVIRQPGSVPVAGVRVDVQSGQGSDVVSGVTGDDGAFALEGLAPGSPRIQLPAQKLFVSPDKENPPLKEAVIELGSAALEGRITRNGRGVSARLTLRRTQRLPGGQTLEFSVNATASADGNFRVADLAPGKWLAFAQADGLTAKGEADIPPEGIAVQVLELGGNAVTGRVVDAKGAPVAGASVQVVSGGEGSPPWRMSMGLTQPMVTRPDGTFSMTPRETGDYTVKAIKLGVGGGSAPAKTGGAAVEVRLLPGTAQVVSQALSFTDGAPLPGAGMELSSEEFWPLRIPVTGKRDDSGIIRVEGLPAGRYIMKVGAKGHSAMRRKLSLRDNETTTIEDVLYEGGTIRWKLVTPLGAPVWQVVVKVKPTDPTSIEEERQATHGESGVFVAEGLMPGTYSATALQNRTTVGTAVFEVKAGQTVEAQATIGE